MESDFQLEFAALVFRSHSEIMLRMIKIYPGSNLCRVSQGTILHKDIQWNELFFVRVQGASQNQSTTFSPCSRHWAHIYSESARNYKLWKAHNIITKAKMIHI